MRVVGHHNHDRIALRWQICLHREMRTSERGFHTEPRSRNARRLQRLIARIVGQHERQCQLLLLTRVEERQRQA